MTNATQEDSMKRTFLAASLLAVIASTSYGQSMVAKIPFDFQFGKTFMPAGRYEVNLAGSLTTLRSENGKVSATALSLPDERHSASTQPSLEFQRYGNDYFLSKIWTGNQQKDRALYKSQREKELARNARSSKQEEVALEAASKNSSNALQTKNLASQGSR